MSALVPAALHHKEDSRYSFLLEADKVTQLSVTYRKLQATGRLTYIKNSHVLV
jgi:hypothetical protein